MLLMMMMMRMEGRMVRRVAVIIWGARYLTAGIRPIGCSFSVHRPTVDHGNCAADTATADTFHGARSIRVAYAAHLATGG